MTGSPAFHLPTDPLPRFLAVFDACRDSGSWWEKQSMALRQAALTLTTVEGRPQEVVRRMRSVASELKGQGGMFSPFQGSLRYIFAAHLMSTGIEPMRLTTEFERMKGFLREERLPRSSHAHTIVTTLVLMEQALQQSGRARISRQQVSRMADVYRAFKENHKWITGADDLGSAALLGEAPGSATQVAAQAHALYLSLRGYRYERGNSLQAVSHILSVHEDPTDAVRRFDAIYQGFRGRGLWMFSSDYDEVASLTFTSAAPSEVVERTLKTREMLRERKYRLSKNESFSVAANIAMLELLNDGRTAHDLNNFAMLLRVHAIIAAQQAAIIASSAAAASAAASAG